jgi:DNA repair photolyase
VKSRPTANPPSRFHAATVSYDDGEGPPRSSVTLLEDHSRSILSHNDSPDLPFRWSANPYRGCLSACAYCVGPETLVLLGDSRTRRIADLRVGDEIYGTRVEGRHRRYVRTHVLDSWTTIKPAYRIVLSDGTELIASGDHRFLSSRGWKHVTGKENGRHRRPHLTTNNYLLGTGRFAMSPTDDESYRRGYLSGLIRGDATLKRYDYSGRRRASEVLYQFRLALVDLEALYRAKRYLLELDVEATEFEFMKAHAGYRPMQAIRTSSRAKFERIVDLIAYPDRPELEWHKGFLAGIFDAEGSHSQHVMRISNADPALIDRICGSLRRLAFDCIVETTDRLPRKIFNVRVRGGIAEHLRFFHTTNPAITRKWGLEGQTIMNRAERRVASITSIGQRRLYDITTGTGDFIANGIISHNCYARPTHEYLDLGAGTDFDTKIVVKPKAAELLRDTFDKPSWNGELVMFSGVTDCYQPVEAQLQLTKQCLEVCLEYRNPVAVISKHALIERDAELLAELAREAGCHVSVSLAWVDAELARAIEPWAPAPARRLQVIETLAKAGVPVGVMCAPVIPGLNDDQLMRVLERARDAGATSAGWVLLRLPGPVAQIFEDRVRVALPLAADKIMHRIRETRGGERLYDPRFHTRSRGEGVYADTIAALFDATVKRLGFDDRDEARVFESRFRRPAKGGQLSLF